MVRKARMITKHGMILVSFIEGKMLPFSNTASDLFLRILPHQSGSLLRTKSVKEVAQVGSKKVNVNCVCVKERSQQTESIDALFSRMAKNGGSLLWLDPTQIPTECLASIFTKWLWNTQPTDNLGLGVVIPSSENTASKEDGFRAWTSTSSGILEKDLERIDLPVWYPSLTREPECLEEISKDAKPFDVFPIVEFPQIIDYAVEKEVALHHYMLDHFRTRTRNFIYLNTESPAEALRTIFGSFEAIPKGGKMPRSLVLTPGGKPVSYLVTLLAGVFAGGIFITPEMERPYAEAQDVWGFAVLKKCE